MRCSCLCHTILCLLCVPNLTIGNHRNAKRIKILNLVPVGRRLIALGFGTRMNGQPIRAARSNRSFDIIHLAGVGIAQADFCGYWDMLRNRLTYRADNLIHGFRFIQQYRAAAMTINRLSRTTKIDIDGGCAKLTRVSGVFCHQLRLATEQLHMNWRARSSLGVMMQLGDILVEYMRGQDMLGHANELTDRPIIRTA